MLRCAEYLLTFIIHWSMYCYVISAHICSLLDYITGPLGAANVIAKLPNARGLSYTLTCIVCGNVNIRDVVSIRWQT